MSFMMGKWYKINIYFKVQCHFDRDFFLPIKAKIIDEKSLVNMRFLIALLVTLSIVNDIALNINAL